MINNSKLTLMMFQESLTAQILVGSIADFIEPQMSQGCSSARWWSSRQPRCL